MFLDIDLQKRVQDETADTFIQQIDSDYCTGASPRYKDNLEKQIATQNILSSIPAPPNQIEIEQGRKIDQIQVD